MPALAAAWDPLDGCERVLEARSCPTSGGRTYVCGELPIETCTYE